MRTARSRCLAAAALVAFGLSSAWAGLALVKTSTKTKGATTITWDSSFADLGYSPGSPIAMTVTWTVDAGAAAYDGFELKRFTPKSKHDPATGTMQNVTYPGNAGMNSVTVDFRFDNLHLDRRRNTEIGNAHFKLFLRVDKDGDGTPESRSGFGVNVHVENPH